MTASFSWPRDALTLANRPAEGSLVPLRTRAELLSRNETTEVYAVAVPLKDVSKVLGAIKSIPGQQTFDLHHLRRVIKDGYLPSALLRARATASGFEAQGPSLGDTDSLASASTEPTFALTELAVASSPPPQSPEPATVHILLCPCTLLSPSKLITHLHAYAPSLFPSPTPSSPSTPTTTIINPTRQARPILTTRVPLHPPSTPSHATHQSLTLWPTIYNPNTVYGPNPATIASAQAELQPTAAQYMSLAQHIGRASKATGQGEGVGAVIVERVPAPNGRGKPTERIVAVAGDKRWTSCPPTTRGVGNGDAAGHAIMRAIEFVARKRRRLLSMASTLPGKSGAVPAVLPSTSPSGNVLSPDLEMRYLDESDNLAPDGYLCLNLDVYVSHEPCVMCSMALVHSRVGRVVFGRRMPRTGGLCAEGSVLPGGTSAEYGASAGEGGRDGGEEWVGDVGQGGGVLGYGLFWRAELNWRFLCWEWRGGGDAVVDEVAVGEAVHA